VQIAEATGAEKYTPDILAKAKQELTNAQDLDAKKSQRKEMITYARGAVQDAEDARVSTLRKMEEEKQHEQAVATQQAQQAAKEAQLAAQQQAAQRAQADAQAQQAQAQAAQAKAQAELAEARAAQAQAAQQAAQQANQQAEQARERLRAQLNNVLQTQETARGLIVNMSDVLFAFNQYALKPDAREALAKVSGILLSYPGLKVQVEGYTDNVGSEQYNQKLSEQRADAVRDYLVSQGVPAANVTSTGYGENDPVADNSTAAGRSKNRRVQLVVSGSAIGIQEGAEEQPAAPPQAAPPAPPPLPQGVSNPPPQ
jgi:outer membrane protein OmpA-like peptidoglycan-associated protein